MTFTLYALPAMMGFLTKLGVLFYCRYSSTRGLQARLFLLFLLGFAVHNAVEVGFFIRDGESLVHSPAFLGRLWFSVAIVIVAFFLHFALLTAAGSQSVWRKFLGGPLPLLLYVPAVVLQPLLWGSSLLVVDFEPMAYTFTKVPGRGFFVWEIYVVGYLCLAVGLLIYGASTQTTAHKRLQNKIVLSGFVPLVALSLIIIGLQRVGFRGFNATATLPFTSTFLLIVAAYAIHHYRLFDVAFYIPWSKARKRKTELYTRIQTVSADIGKLDSPLHILQRIADTLRCRVALFGGPQPWSAAPGDEPANEDNRLIIKFPSEALEKVDRIATADEVADRDPELHRLMSQYQVGAIVPFKSYGAVPGYCLLLGRQFNDEIYSSLDFKVVDQLFSAMAQRFFEDFLLVRSQLAAVEDQLHDATRNLVRAEQNVTGVNLKLSAARKQNRNLRDEMARLRRANFKVMKTENGPVSGGGRTLDQYLARREKEALLCALDRTGGKKAEAARRLGVSLRTLNDLIERYAVDTGEDS